MKFLAVYINNIKYSALMIINEKIKSECFITFFKNNYLNLVSNFRSELITGN